jgi:hypothetical protein
MYIIVFEIQLKYEATTSDRKLQLAESINLSDLSITNYMEAPTPRFL